MFCGYPEHRVSESGQVLRGPAGPVNEVPVVSLPRCGFLIPVHFLSGSVRARKGYIFVWHCFFFLIRITKYSNSRCSYWPLVKSNFQNITDSRNVSDVKWFCISIIYTPLLLKRFEISNLVMKGVEYLSSLRDDPLLNRVLRPSHHYCSQNNPFIPRFEARVPCE